MHCLITKFRVSRLLPLSFVCACLLTIFAACGTTVGIFSGGGNWQASGLNIAPLHALATDPNAPQKMYAGNEQGAIFVTSDSGDHWTRTKADIAHLAAIAALGFDASGKKLYAAAASGLWVSPDGGLHWSSVTASSLPRDTFTALAFDVKSSDNFSVGTAQHGVFRTTDAGRSWTGIASGFPAGSRVNALSYVTDQKQLWAATSAGAYLLKDGETAWKALNQGLPPVAVNALVPASLTGGEPDLVFAGTERGFFSSRDQGAHWSAGKDTLAGTTVTSILLDFRAADAKKLYAGTRAGVLLSSDQGQTWQSVAPGLPKGKTVNALALGGETYGQLVAAQDDLYLFPGSGSGSQGSNFLPILLFIGFFGLLYYFSQGRRRRQLINRAAKLAETPAQDVEPTLPSEQ